MKKLILFFALVLPSFGAFNDTMQWDVRATATASDVNGCGFDPGVASPGTDFSLQDTAQIAYTDLVIDGTTNTHVTSAGNPFDSTSPGNVINVTSGTGFTVQRVEILSVLSGVATVDKSLGTLSSTGGQGNMGGSCITNAKALSLMVGGNTMWTKSGTYTISSSLGGTSVTPIIWQGYHSTHGDISAVSNNGTQPLITTTTNTSWIFQIANGSQIIYLSNLSFSSTAGTRPQAVNVNNSGGGVTVENSIFTGVSCGVCGGNGTAIVLLNSAIVSGTGLGVQAGSSTSLIIKNSFIYGNGTGSTCTSSNAGVQPGQGTAVTISSTVIAANTACGVLYNTTASNSLMTISNSTIANNGRDGVTILNAGNMAGGLSVESDVIYGNGGYGVNADASMASRPSYLTLNFVGSNASGNYHNLTSLGDIALTANPFTSSTNFAPNSTSGGGALLKGAGLPSTFNSAATVGAPDGGAVQSAAGITTGGTRSYATAQ